MNLNRLLEFLSFVFALPEKIRKRINRKTMLSSFESVGKDFVFNPINSIIPKEGKKTVGDNVFIGDNAYLGGDFHIGNNVMFGPNVTLLGGNHLFAIKGKSPRFLQPIPGLNPEPINIEDETWIGANVVILGNVTIGIGAVVGAGSVVCNNIAPFTVSVGNPCKPNKKIFTDSDLLLHLLEIGYDENLSRTVIDRRQKELLNSNLPCINNTELISSYIYAPVN